MDSLYPTTATEGYEHFRNDAMNTALNESSKTLSMFSLKDSDMFHFILYTIVRGPFCVVGFVANIICYKVLKEDIGKKHHATTFLLQALAVADNLVLTLFFFSGIYLGLPTMLDAGKKIMSEGKDLYLKMYVPFLRMTRPVSVWITVLIAINRYIAVCRLFDAHRLTSLKRTKIQVAVVFTLAIICRLPLFFQYTIVSKIGPDSVFSMVYSIAVENISLMIIPLIILIVLNTRIICELRKVDKWRDAFRQNGRRSENNITVVMVVIIIVFIVCNIPFQIQLMAEYTDQDSDGWYALKCVSHNLMVVNSSTNFLVYYVFRKRFRRAFRNTLPCSQPEASGRVDGYGLGTTATTTA